MKYSTAGLTAWMGPGKKARYYINNWEDLIGMKAVRSKSGKTVYSLTINGKDADTAKADAVRKVWISDEGELHIEGANPEALRAEIEEALKDRVEEIVPAREVVTTYATRRYEPVTGEVKARSGGMVQILNEKNGKLEWYYEKDLVKPGEDPYSRMKKFEEKAKARALARDLEEKSASVQSNRPEVQEAVRRSFKRGTKTLQDRMDSILRNMAYQGGFSSPAEARRWLDDPVSYTQVTMLLTDADKLPEPQRSKMLDLVNRQAYSYRFNRERALKTLVEIWEQGITKDILNGTVPVMDDVAIESFGRAMFELQKGVGVGFAVEHIPVRMLERAVNSELTFTKTKGYVKSVTIPMREALFEGILTGKSSGDIARDVQAVSGKSEWVSKAFARTALTEVSNEAERKSLEDAGLKKYRFVATLDERTCPVCGRLDGQVFYLKDAKAGTNFPPMHRNCRCVHTAVLTTKARINLQRRGRDAEGRDILVPQSMTYTEWKAQYMPKKARKR